MNHLEQHAKPASTPKTGIFALLRNLLGAKGTGAPSPRPAFLTLTLLATTTCALLAAGLLFTGAASAAVTHKFLPEPSKKFGEDGLGISGR